MSDAWDGRGVSLAALAYPFTAMLPIDGVSICIFDPSGQPTMVTSSNETASRLEEIQFDTGEGPLFSVFNTGAPVVVPDLIDDSTDDWLFFRQAAVGSGARALTVLPLMIGAVCIGAVSLHWKSPNELAGMDVATAVTAARSISVPTVRAGSRLAGRSDLGSPSDTSMLRPDVHQAVGMVLAQLDISATDAFARLRAYAFAEGRSLSVVAAEVVARTLDFSKL